MEIKTTEDIMYEYVDEEDHCLKLYDINPNVQWVRVEDMKQAIQGGFGLNANALRKHLLELLSKDKK